MIAKRALDMPPFIVMEINEKAQELERQGKNVIHMEIGEPDFTTPQVIKNAGCRAIKDDKTRYTHSLGLLELREAIVEHYHDKYGVALSPEQVIVTSGTSPAMLLVFAALLNPGEKVILSNPGYACYPNFIRFADGEPSFINVHEEDGFQYRPEAIESTLDDMTKAILINSPSNPTGTILSEPAMRRIAEIVGEKEDASEKPYIVSDEIYHGLSYEGKEHSILEFTDRAFVLNGFSKLYAMTGWRLGYAIAPKEFIRPMQKVQQNLFISANSFVQWAGITALKETAGDIDRMVRTYNERRKFLIPRLREIGFGIAVEPTGAFYVLANAKKFGADSYKLALDILNNALVAVTPGIDFGSNAEGYLRFSYANSLENIVEACDRLARFIRE
ncbi:MAG: aspartate aminotransferase [Candidatus Aquicultor secundus]|uniref:Aminotransferase n=2 Tax=Candidatus Aquicultor secundus TaxID=1973895 RepID=A0A2M7T6M3_9ACTN|nr:pyridoxal phosphate-dependent aminotransferase [Candidatus Aquicultor secundus]NCO66838.1 pyridoxal phosphate-dependent aminotransferase [Solirubrobacter sp.]OIO88064.1 MAG: aspartate aminotransferase [Candidatus Aquicultor secundus]PIU26319.1 MAG: aspartate aminotransferase [Candidatus Aquicultor secundus]PIW23060.1 MAG: aspartate aminotransferase [Candidatus Aquicultor secundus]PIX52956.1 MAG: aspartate aminotransferase [Candidatus Aquicultor secundus]